MDIVINVSLLLVFFFIALKDYQTKKIDNIPLIIMLVIGVYTKYNHLGLKQIVIDLLLSVLFYVLLIFIVLLMEEKSEMFIMGGGDLKLISVMYFLLKQGVIFIALVTAILLLFRMISMNFLKKNKPKEVALAPYLYLGYVIFLCGGNNV